MWLYDFGLASGGAISAGVHMCYSLGKILSFGALFDSDGIVATGVHIYLNRAVFDMC